MPKNPIPPILGGNKDFYLLLWHVPVDQKTFGSDLARWLCPALTKDPAWSDVESWIEFFGDFWTARSQKRQLSYFIELLDRFAVRNGIDSPAPPAVHEGFYATICWFHTTFGDVSEQLDSLHDHVAPVIQELIQTQRDREVFELELLLETCVAGSSGPD